MNAEQAPGEVTLFTLFVQVFSFHNILQEFCAQILKSWSYLLKD